MLNNHAFDMTNMVMIFIKFSCHHVLKGNCLLLLSKNGLCFTGNTDNESLSFSLTPSFFCCSQIVQTAVRMDNACLFLYLLLLAALISLHGN